MEVNCNIATGWTPIEPRADKSREYIEDDNLLTEESRISNIPLRQDPTVDT